MAEFWCLGGTLQSIQASKSSELSSHIHGSLSDLSQGLKSDGTGKFGSIHDVGLAFVDMGVHLNHLNNDCRVAKKHCLPPGKHLGRRDVRLMTLSPRCSASLVPAATHESAACLSSNTWKSSRVVSPSHEPRLSSGRFRDSVVVDFLSVVEE